MKKVNHSQAYLRKRKMMLVLPLLVTPFITLAFWSMGGGKDNSIKRGQSSNQGLNLNLPDANLKNDNFTDKLSFYDKADKDSIKRHELMENDPYYKHGDTIPAVTNELEQITQTTASKYNQRLNTTPYEVSSSSPDQKIMQRLGALQTELNKPVLNDQQKQLPDKPEQSNEGFSTDVDRLEYMLQNMTKGNGGNQEIDQLNTTLDKILDIQNPARVKERLQAESVQNKEKVYAVSRQPHTIPISFMGNSKKDTTSAHKKVMNSFYSSEDITSLPAEESLAEAVIHQTQTLTDGSIVKLRLSTDIFIHGTLIPKDNFLYGLASLNGERLEIKITSIRYLNSLFPVKLNVYDLDGLSGVFVPGSITRDVAKQGVDNSLQTMELASLNPSIAAQATTAGISTVKSLLSRKVKLVKVVVKEGYRVLLKDENNK